MHPALRVWTLVERLGDAVLVALLSAMTVVCLMQVLWRYFLAAPLTWSEEAANYLLVWCSALAAWQAWWFNLLGALLCFGVGLIAGYISAELNPATEQGEANLAKWGVLILNVLGLTLLGIHIGLGFVADQ